LLENQTKKITFERFSQHIGILDFGQCQGAGCARQCSKTALQGSNFELCASPTEKTSAAMIGAPMHKQISSGRIKALC
jgi:hypothetical protein